MENEIWNAITDSAKKKFDYSSFKETFPFDPDMVIFTIIISLGTNKSEEIITLDLFNQMLMTGFIWDKGEISNFIKDKKTLFKHEIYAAQLANDMLSKGNKPVVVLAAVSQIL